MVQCVYSSKWLLHEQYWPNAEQLGESTDKKWSQILDAVALAELKHESGHKHVISQKIQIWELSPDGCGSCN